MTLFVGPKWSEVSVFVFFFGVALVLVVLLLGVRVVFGLLAMAAFTGLVTFLLLFVVLLVLGNSVPT